MEAKELYEFLHEVTTLHQSFKVLHYLLKGFPFNYHEVHFPLFLPLLPAIQISFLSQELNE